MENDKEKVDIDQTDVEDTTSENNEEQSDNNELDDELQKQVTSLSKQKQHWREKAVDTDSGKTYKELYEELKASKKEEKQADTPAEKQEAEGNSSELEKRLERLEEDRKREQLDQTFDKVFNKALEDNDDLKGVANKEVIKKLFISDPTQKVSDLIQETYGNATKGTYTAENTADGGKNMPNKVSFEDALNDPEQYAKLKKDPKKFSEFHEWYHNKKRR